MPTDDEARALAPRADPSADLYERRYMAGEGTVLYRDKQRSPLAVTGLLGVISLLTVLPMVLGMSMEWAAALVAIPILFVVWMLFSVLRVTVSEGSVKVQYGLFGPTIPIAAIESAEPTTYRWSRFGGWGIRLGPGGEWLYNMPGDEGRAVRVVWRDAKGRARKTLIGSKHHEQLAAAIAQARRALPGAPETEALPPGSG